MKSFRNGLMYTLGCCVGKYIWFKVLDNEDKIKDKIRKIRKTSIPEPVVTEPVKCKMGFAPIN